MARKNKARSFMEGFSMGQHLARSYQQASDEAEVRDIMDSKPETSQGFTQQDGAQLEAIANARDAEGKPYYQVDTAEGGGYQVKPNFAAPDGQEYQPTQMSQKTVSDFRGNRVEGMMSDRQVADAKMQAVTDVVGRRDPVAGMRMRREAVRDQRDEQRFGWEQSRANREERTASQAEADQNAARAIEKEVGDWMGSRLVGPDGTKRAATVDDHLAATQYKAQKLLESGRTDAAQQAFKEFQANSFVKIQLEGAERDKALSTTVAAVNAGDLNAAKDFYNRFMPDGSNVTDIKRGQNGEIIIQRESLDGRKMPAMTMKDANQFTAALATFKDPMALYNWTQNEFRNNMAIKADARADRADSRAGASSAREEEDRRERREASVGLFMQGNPNATPEQIRAVRAGVLPPVAKRGEFKTEAGDITSLLGTPAVDEKGQPIMDPMTGKQVVNRNPDRESKLFKFMKEKNITDTNEGIQRFFTEANGGAAPKAAPPQKGDRVEGFEFLGGDPNNQKNWRQVSSGAVR